MRLWSLHPKYLDTKGLVACWRESLLAQSVLLGNSSGYSHHPQLSRFRSTIAPPAHIISSYLYPLLSESVRRGYHFNPDLIIRSPIDISIEVTVGQLKYEWDHLQTKLSNRDRNKFEFNRDMLIDGIEPHPLFTVCYSNNDIEPWEII